MFTKILFLPESREQLKPQDSWQFDMIKIWFKWTFMLFLNCMLGYSSLVSSCSPSMCQALGFISITGNKKRPSVFCFYFILWTEALEKLPLCHRTAYCRTSERDSMATGEEQFILSTGSNLEPSRRHTFGASFQEGLTGKKLRPESRQCLSVGVSSIRRSQDRPP